MSKEYGVICILEMTVEGENQRDARRIVEDAIYEAFDSKAEKDCSGHLCHQHIMPCLRFLQRHSVIVLFILCHIFSNFCK